MPWIWLDAARYPQYQKNFHNINGTDLQAFPDGLQYAVTEFRKTLGDGRRIEKVQLRVSADCFFHLYANDEWIGLGPAAAGGDFLCTGKAPKHYQNEYELFPAADTLELYARVRLQPEVLTDYSRGQGGFFAQGTLTYTDGSTESFETDESWLARPDTACTGYLRYDSRIPAAEFAPAVPVADIWHAEAAPIPMLDMQEIGHTAAVLAPGETKTVRLELPRIWGAYPAVTVDGSCTVTLATRELDGQNALTETLYFGKAGAYRSFRMHSLSILEATLENTGDAPLHAEISLTATYYPVAAEGQFITSDEGLNKVFDVCKHTLKICRQTLHLDSTTHQELMACTGDYYIESLMTVFCFGDLRLAKFDVMRTADLLVQQDGRMFHTTYSLIWVQMLWDIYQLTGDAALLQYCRPALDVLLHRFARYLGGTGVLEHQPDHMFVDWTVIDDFSMHHPPKALGQAVLNAFYYKALTDAEEIYDTLQDAGAATACRCGAQQLREAFERCFWDEEKQLYCDGLGTPHGDGTAYSPFNVNKRYFSKYPNILAAAYGLCSDERAENILERITLCEKLQDIQPYFMHYLLEALRKHGLFGKFGKPLLQRWVEVVNECDKGLKEGWIAPEPGYSFDHSHAWGGTPAYQMPMALLGLTVCEPGMRRLKLAPQLYWLEHFDIAFPTVHGTVRVRKQKDLPAQVEAPAAVTILLDE